MINSCILIFLLVIINSLLSQMFMHQHLHIQNYLAKINSITKLLNMITFKFYSNTSFITPFYLPFLIIPLTLDSLQPPMRHPSRLTHPQHSSSHNPQPEPQPHPIQQFPPEPCAKIQNPPSQQQQQQIKTPKSKRSYKLSKSNPQSLSPLKINERKLSKNLVEKQKNTNQLFGHWNVEENKRYHWFLQVHFSHFMNRSMRRMDRIFTLMAKFVATREAEQCRSHHQKMQKKHKTFAKILLNLRLSHYKTGHPQSMLIDMQTNSVDLIQPLLTHQSLLQNSDNASMMLTPKSSISSPEKRETFIEPQLGEMVKIQFEENEMQMNEMDEEKEEKYDLMEPLMGEKEEWNLELQSSKNYFFKLELMQQAEKDTIKKENLLDEDYQNNLDIHNILFS